MVSKDQAIGGAILLVCVVVAVVYLVALFGYEQLIKPWLNIGSAADVRFWLIAVPVFVAFVAILFIGAWIGWTMATTPPPKPIEEITTEIEDKKEEPKVEESESMKAPEAPSTEEKSTAKKKK
jgi:TRAP-type C4-dicarboxylate transport system permease small subunit